MPRLIASGFVGLAAAACLFGATDAKADIVFCNQFGRPIYVSIAYPQANGSFISRGWLPLANGDCSPFDTAIHVKTFYFRGESEPYRDANGRRARYLWGKGRNFAIWQDNNYQYYDAQQRVLKSTLAEFTQGPVSDNDDVSATVTFKEGGSTVTTK